MGENRKIFFSLALRSIVQGEIERERERERRFESASIFLYQCGNRNEGVSSIILTT